MKKENDVESDVWQAARKKPHKIRIKVGGGDVDGCCEGKNAWDEVMRTLIPHILDISVVSWVDHHLDSIEKLKLTLDKEFEYVDNKLSIMGFKNMVKRWLKTKRTKLKTRFLEGGTECPINIEPIHWERLTICWSKLEILKKVEQMSNAKNKVKNLTSVGQTGRTKKEARLVN
jgi:hypothetical protein